MSTPAPTPTPSPPAKLPKPRAPRRPAGAGTPVILRVLDATLLIGFLTLTFLLGVFPLKDTDFWWHLRTGDLIRQTGQVPHTDLFTYMAAGQPWVDLHWLFQVAISRVYAWGGVPALTVAKCVVTTVAVLLLVTARRREWPLWAMLVGWLPALLVLGGRMYVRPETLTLLYLSVYLAVLTRIDRRPWLALVLPFVQVAWVNTQGLFVLGPILWGFAILDALLRPGSLAPGRGRWWRVILTTAALTGLACLVNPYGLTGMLYPLQLARTMGNPVFSNSIAELTPIPLFIQRDGLVSLPLRIQLLTMVVGALSFLGPLVWVAVTRIRPAPTSNAPVEQGRAKKSKSEKSSKRASKASAAPPPPLWRLSPFRLLLFLAFTLLSWQATRNSHQFAAVVGSVTAWNLGEWAAALRRRREEFEGGDATATGRGLAPRFAALAAVVGVFAWVATGSFYAAANEGRVIGLGEQPLWFPHDAVRFAGRPEMPPKFLSFHIGHASLYDYYSGPERKVYADARLEVIGPDLFERYMDLQKRITQNERGWERELDEAGRPVILVDNEINGAVTARLVASSDYRCVYFDPVAAVFVHVGFDDVVRRYQVDFAGRHFHPRPADEPHGLPTLLASAKGLRNVASLVASEAPAKAWPLAALGMDHAWRVVQADPSGGDGWKMLGQLELLRDPILDTMRTSSQAEPIPRFRSTFDPVFDLPAARATYALSRALDATPDDFTTLLSLQKSFEARGMAEAAVPLLDRLIAVPPVNGMQARNQAAMVPLRAGLQASLGPEPPGSWANLSELSQTVNGLLARGRAASAADYLERAAPAGSRPWEEADRIATLRLHLGDPVRARAAWESAAAPSRPALRDARVAVTHLVEGDFAAARQRYRIALQADPELFEARYGLAVLEQDTGRAADALEAARRAVTAAPTDVSRQAAQAVVAFVTPYAVSPIAGEK